MKITYKCENYTQNKDEKVVSNILSGNYPGWYDSAESNQNSGERVKKMKRRKIWK